MLIERVEGSANVFAMILQPGNLEPIGKPLIDSLCTVSRCQAGYVITTNGVIEFGGFFLLVKAPLVKALDDVDVAVRTRDLIVFNAPGRATVVMSPIAPPRIQTILDEQ